MMNANEEEPVDLDAQIRERKAIARTIRELVAEILRQSATDSFSFSILNGNGEETVYYCDRSLNVIRIYLKTGRWLKTFVYQYSTYTEWCEMSNLDWGRMVVVLKHRLERVQQENERKRLAELREQEECEARRLGIM